MFLPTPLSEYYKQFIPSTGPYTGYRLGVVVNPVFQRLMELYDQFINDDHVKEIYLTAGNQCGKTLSTQVVAAYALLELGEDVAFYSPTIVTSRAIAQALGYSTKHMGEVPHFSSSYITYPERGVTLHWRGQSDSQRAQLTTRFLFISEADKITGKSTDEQNPIDQMRARTYAYRNPKLFFESTYTHRTGLLATAEESAGVKYQFHHLCGECGNYFIPQIDLIFSDGYGCPVCGVLIPEADRIGCVQGGKFIPVETSGTDTTKVFVRFTTMDSMLVRACPEIAKIEQNYLGRKRIYMQYLALPPPAVDEGAPPEPEASTISRGYIPKPGEGWWCLATDTGAQLHWVLVVKRANEDFIHVSDFNTITGNLEAQVKVLKSVIASYPRENGLVLYDYGYMGENYLKLWNRPPKDVHSIMPVRGMSNIRPQVGVDVKFGSTWRLRRMKVSGIPALQVISIPAKDMVMGLLHSHRIKVFGTDMERVEVKQFLKSITRSEVPVEAGGKRTYKVVASGNHFFDALVYAICGLECVGGVLPDTKPVEINEEVGKAENAPVKTKRERNPVRHLSMKGVL